MAAVLGRTEIGVREFGIAARIPDHPKAKLMYYLDCICSVLDLSDYGNLCRLRDYTNFFCLTEYETNKLYTLVLEDLSPDKLHGKVIFQNDDMCGDNNNAFFELSTVQHNLFLTDTIVIGGQRRSVKKIMALKRRWVLDFWVDPLRQIAGQARLRSTHPSPKPATGSCCCNII